MKARLRRPAIALCCVIAACAPKHVSPALEGFSQSGGERVRVLDIYPGVTATIVAPSRFDLSQPVDLVLYALPNGNSTLQTIGRKMINGLDWHFDIQNIGAQTRALRTMGLPNAVVAYLEADSKSWPSWRQTRGYEKANHRIVEIVDQVRRAVGGSQAMRVTLAGHSGGGSFMFGFIEGQDSIPRWIDRIVFLDANYNFDWSHGEKLVKWLRDDARHRLVVLAYDDRNIMLDGKKVVSDSGGTWRASERMINYLREPYEFTVDTLGEFRRYRARQVDVLLHPNPDNRILHTMMIGEMNGYMHAMLVGRAGYDGALLRSSRAYSAFTADSVSLPPASPPDIPRRDPNAMTGSEFIRSITSLSREEREAAILRELLSGNIPSFLRKLRTVDVAATGPDSARHVLSYEVMPDYLAVGSDADYVRIPMIPYTAQAFCDAYGFVMPTRRMVNDIWAAATIHLEPKPLTIARESPMTFLQHHNIIEDQLEGSPRGSFVAGIKKDVVVTNKLLEKPHRVAIYGWHYQNGQPIQPLYTGHIDWYVDYSHGIRPVRRSMTLDGASRPYEKIVADSLLSFLLSDEGPVTANRYER